MVRGFWILILILELLDQNVVDFHFFVELIHLEIFDNIDLELSLL